MSYKTPNVYVEEQSILPPSVAEVSTAIPAFIGYTERAGINNTLQNKAIRISSLLAYQSLFGGPPLTSFDVTVMQHNEQLGVSQIKPKSQLSYCLYDCLRLYFANGGGDAYIVSVNTYQASGNVDKTAIEQGLDALEKEDEPTLIVMTDRVALSSDDYGALCQKVLMHCAKLKDRFALFDAGKDNFEQIKEFRDKLGVDHLKYGAAYFPYLRTNLGYHYQDDAVKITGIHEKNHPKWRFLSKETGFSVTYEGNEKDTPRVQITEAKKTERVRARPINIDIDDNKLLTITLPTGTKTQDIVQAWGLLNEGDKKNFRITQPQPEADQIITEIEQALTDNSSTDNNRTFSHVGNGWSVTYQGHQNDHPKIKMIKAKESPHQEMNSGVRISIESNNLLSITLPNTGATLKHILDVWNEKPDHNESPFKIKIEGSQKELFSEEKIIPSEIKLIYESPEPKLGYFSYSAPGFLVTYNGDKAGPKIKIIKNSRANFSQNTNVTAPQISIDDNNTLTITLPTEHTQAKDLLAVWNNIIDKEGFEICLQGTGEAPITEVSTQALTYVIYLSALKSKKTAIYNEIKAKIDNQRLTLPPSAAIAGVYARIDRERGVWKSPANVALVDVIGPTLKITDKEQEDLNIDAMAGKSINALRSFTGKGTLVWGARTLAGNDNEWRYIAVRRLFNLIEESLQKSTAFAVFEPNNAMTWLKVRTMAQSYLDDLWRKGALAGATPEEAYFVKADRGQTMTEKDILDGKLIVEVGVAAVRPAEFIVLRFAHKLQQA